MAGGRFEVTLALLATVALALVALHHGGGSAELESAAAGGSKLAQRISHLEAESAQIEQVRLRAKALNSKIQSLERRGQSGAEDSSALAKEAAQLKARLSDLASDAHLDPASVLSQNPVATGHHYLDDERRDWPKQNHAHQYIDDDSVGHSSSHARHYIDDDSREVERQKASARAGINVGVLGRTPKHAAGRGRMHYIDDDSWKSAPTQDQWGQEHQGKVGSKKAIDYYDYGNPTKMRPWAYGPKESAFGADFVQGVKGQKDIAFGNSWNKVKKDDSWQVAPKGDSLLDNVKGRQAIEKTVGSKSPTESKAWSKAAQWFDNMRAKTARQVDAKMEDVDVRKQVEARMHHFSHFDKSVTSRVAKDLKVLHEARAAEAALRKEAAQPAQAQASAAPLAAPPLAPAAVQAPAVEDLERDGALTRTEGMLNALMGDADSKYGNEETPPVETAAQREQAGWEVATEQAAEPMHLEAARQVPAVAQQTQAKMARTSAESEAVYKREAKTMQSQLQKARAEVMKLPTSERAAAEGAIKAMEGALKGAQVSANALERNKRQVRAMGKEASDASKQVASLETDPVVRQAEEAQQRVWRLQQQLQAVKFGKDNRAQLHVTNARNQIHKRVLEEAAQAAARGEQIKASTSKAGSRLAKLGINTGEGVWGDNKSPADTYEPGLTNI